MFDRRIASSAFHKGPSQGSTQPQRALIATATTENEVSTSVLPYTANPPIGPLLGGLFRTEMLLSIYRMRASYTRYFCEHLHLHGFRDLYQTKCKPVKAFWTCVLVAAFAVLTYECTLSATQYRATPMLVSHEIKSSQRIRRIPDYLICSLHRFSTASLAKYGIGKALEEHLHALFDYAPTQRYITNKPALSDTVPTFDLDNQLTTLLHVHNLSLPQLITEISQRCEDIVIYCANFKGQKRLCCQTATPFLTEEGLCYRMQGANQPSAGFDYGFNLLFAFAQEPMRQTRGYLEPKGLAIHLFETENALGFDTTFIPSHTHVSLPLRANRVEYSSYGKTQESECDPSENYSRVDCFNQCVFQPAAQACNCSTILTLHLTNLPLCSPYELYTCYRDVMRDLPETRNLTSIASHATECHKKCKKSCKFWQYEPLTSYTDFPNPRYIIASENRSLEKRIQTVVTIFYESLDYTIIRQRPQITITTFIATIGGHLLLWVGASILTLFQLAVFILYTVWTGVKGSQPNGLLGSMPTAALSEKPICHQESTFDFEPCRRDSRPRNYHSIVAKNGENTLFDLRRNY